MHISVMPTEVMELLQLPPGGTAVDGTLGLAGHAELMAKQIGPSGHLIGIDRDHQALAEAKRRLISSGLRIDLLQGNYADIRRLLAEVKIDKVDGILLDIGISSFQLDNPARGFAFKTDGPLDMRMDQDKGQSAADLVNHWPEDRLAEIIAKFGEERFAKRIAKAIVFKRSSQQITTTHQLAELIKRALPSGYTRGRIHPATRTFQALRIVVNDELQSLTKGLVDGVSALKSNGRMCVISFHSLEDRIVKNTFRRLKEEGIVEVLTKKPLEPSQQECMDNPRSRSAKLRAIRKI